MPDMKNGKVRVLPPSDMTKEYTYIYTPTRGRTQAHTHKYGLSQGDMVSRPIRPPVISLDVTNEQLCHLHSF